MCVGISNVICLNIDIFWDAGVTATVDWLPEGAWWKSLKGPAGDLGFPTVFISFCIVVLQEILLKERILWLKALKMINLVSPLLLSVGTFRLVI